MVEAIQKTRLRAVILLIGLSLIGCGPSILRPDRPEGRIVVVYQPSHQTDTGREFSEAAVCNAIAEAAITASNGTVVTHKVWSHDVPGLRFARRGSNTMVDHTSAVVGDSLTGYAWELRRSNEINPFVFISIHNNGGTNRHALWGYIHEGDQYEAANRELVADLIAAVADVTGLENRGVWLDSSTGRNDYRCTTTGKLAFYSLDENVNTAPYRVLLEIGDNRTSRELLQDPAKQKAMGEAIQRVVEKWWGRE
ncbi:MAG: N-acetylmuramoyl-L-alanine amidase [Bacteroidota bacterium]